MTTAIVFWPAVLGCAVLGAGIVSYRQRARDASPAAAFGLVTLGPTFIAASLAAFAGEHFTAAASLAALVPTWLPAHLFFAYFVGVAHLAAALSIVARRYVRWSALGIAVMFTIFVLLMDLPAAIQHPTTRIDWILAARETTFAIGGLAMFATATREWLPPRSRRVASIVRIWTAFVLVFYGIDHLLHLHYTPGVPDSTLIASWVPFPVAIVATTGILLIACGLAMLLPQYAGSAAAYCGLLMTVLTLGLYVPQFFLAPSAAEAAKAINFVFDTLLFAGTMLVISRAILMAELPAVADAVVLGSSAAAQ